MHISQAGHCRHSTSKRAISTVNGSGQPIYFPWIRYQDTLRTVQSYLVSAQFLAAYLGEEAPRSLLVASLGFANSP